jgi:serine/threonine-protein kinase
MTAMVVNTALNLVGLIRQYPLLDAAQLDELVRVLVPRHADPRALAQELMRRDWLTAFQLNQLFQGHGDELVQGDYVLLERLGGGGMGRVFRAKNRKHGFVAALKLIHLQRDPSPEVRRRFRREMAAACQLDHANIVRGVDVREKDGTLFFAMELLQGIDLFRLVRQRGPLDPVEACAFAGQAAMGLQHAHEHGVIHRDLKPANLFLSVTDRTVKILDFGLVRLEDVGDGGVSVSTLTKAGVVMGTADYIAPEQARNSHSADVRSDLYSLGCTLYFLLAGRVPFPGGTMTEKLIHHQFDPPAPLLQLRPDTPPPVVAIVQKLMAKDPADRYQSASELAGVLAHGPGEATLSDLVLVIPETQQGESASAWGLESTVVETPRPTQRPPPPDRRWWLILAIAIFGTFVLGALLLVKLLAGR